MPQMRKSQDQACAITWSARGFTKKAPEDRSKAIEPPATAAAYLINVSYPRTPSTWRSMCFRQQDFASITYHRSALWKNLSRDTVRSVVRLLLVPLVELFQPIAKKRISWDNSYFCIRNIVSADQNVQAPATWLRTKDGNCEPEG